MPTDTPAHTARALAAAALALLEAVDATHDPDAALATRDASVAAARAALVSALDERAVVAVALREAVRHLDAGDDPEAAAALRQAV